MDVTEYRAEILLFNPYHDKLGKFATKAGNVTGSIKNVAQGENAKKVGQWVKDHKKELIAAGIIVGTTAAVVGAGYVAKKNIANISSTTRSYSGFKFTIHSDPKNFDKIDKKLIPEFVVDYDEVKRFARVDPAVKKVRYYDDWASAAKHVKKGGSLYHQKVAAKYLAHKMNLEVSGNATVGGKLINLFGSSGLSRETITHEILHSVPRKKNPGIFGYLDSDQIKFEESVVDSIVKRMGGYRSFKSLDGYVYSRASMDKILKDIPKHRQLDVLRGMLLYSEQDPLIALRRQGMHLAEFNFNLPRKELVMLAIRSVLSERTNDEMMGIIYEELEKL